MKRYIRLTDNSICDTTNIKEETGTSIIIKDKGENILINKEEDIVVESDNILDLLQVGDLVSSTKNYVWQIRNNYTLECESLLDDIIEIYTKQGDNFVLVWTKEE